MNVPPPIPSIEDKEPTEKGIRLPKKPFGTSLPSLNSCLLKNKFTETKKAIKAKIKVSQKPEISPAIIAPIIEPNIVGKSHDFKTL